ncbi:MAG: hypothetical protein QW579_04290 [Desulfurococcaceae archaeon]
MSLYDFYRRAYNLYTSDYYNTKFSLKNKTLLSELMFRCHKNNNLCIYLIYGRRGAGKSTYALMSADIMERMLGNDGVCCVDMNNVIFAVDELIDRVKSVSHRLEKHKSTDYELRLPYLIIDDAGVYFSKYISRYKVKATHAVVALLDVLRIIASNVVLTTPDYEHVLKAMREDLDTYFIEISRYDGEYSKAEFWSTPIIVPIGNRRIYRRKMAVEIFRPHTPCYEIYYEKRKQIVLDAINNLEDLIGGSKKEETILKNSVLDIGDESEEYD